MVLLLLRQLRVPCNLRRGCGLLLRLVSRSLAAGGGAHTRARTALCRVREFLGGYARFQKAGTQHPSYLPHCALSPGSCEGVRRVSVLLASLDRWVEYLCRSC